jgi:glyceraldehyde 3-phosphate dehydrogenase
VDLTFVASRETTKEEVNRIIKTAADGALKGILAYNTEPLVSSDFNHTTESSHFDAKHTTVIGNLVKIMAWYDNEWGFSCRMLDAAVALMNAK